MQPKRPAFAVNGSAHPQSAAASQRNAARWERTRQWHAAGTAQPPSHRVVALRERLAEEWATIARELQRAGHMTQGVVSFEAACSAIANAVGLLPEDEPALAKIVGASCAAGPDGEPMAGPLHVEALAASLFDDGPNAKGAGLRAARAALVHRLPYGVAGNAQPASGETLAVTLEQRLRRLRDVLVTYATATPPASGAKKAGARSSSRLLRQYPPNYPTFACARRQVMNTEYVERLRGTVDPRAPVRVLRGRATLPNSVKAGSELPPPPPDAAVVEAAAPGDEHKWLTGEQLGAALTQYQCYVGRAELAGIMKRLDPSLTGRCNVAAVLERFGLQLLKAKAQRSTLGPMEWDASAPPRGPAATPPLRAARTASAPVRRAAPSAKDHAHASGTFLGGSVPNQLSPFGAVMKVGKDPEVSTVGCPRRNDAASGPALAMDWASTLDERVTVAMDDPPWSRQLVDSIRRLPSARPHRDPDGPATHLGRERRGDLHKVAIRSVDGSVQRAR